MVYNEIDIEISTEQGENDDGPLRAIDYRYFECVIKIRHSIAVNKYLKDTIRTFTYKGDSPSVMESVRKAFQSVLDKQFYNMEVNYALSSRVNYQGHWRDLPWHLEISHHTEEMQELIRSVFSGGEVFEAKALLEA